MILWVTRLMKLCQHIVVDVLKVIIFSKQYTRDDDKCQS